MKNKITANSTLSKILACPKAEKILVKYNLPCLGCPMASYEMGTLEISEVCKMYDIDLKKLLQELNKSIDEKK